MDDTIETRHPKMPRIGQLIDERYRIESVIATGGMGVVLRAEHVAMERTVALKFLHPHVAAADKTVVERFHREVQLAKTLDHHNTIRLYDSGKTEDGLHFVAMEHLEGQTLDELLAQRGALRVWRAVDLTLQMLDGLAEAHARGFIHRDMKPSNVFVSRNRRSEDVVKLLDFGIAKPLVDAGADLTGTGTICGTPNYVAPEYLRSEPVGKPCDVYAVGLILLEMLQGRRVFEADSPMETMTMRLEARPAIPFLIEESPLAGVIRKAVAKNPQDRYADADAMYQALRPVAERLPAELLARRVDRPSPVRLGEEPARQRTEGFSKGATRLSMHTDHRFEPPVSPKAIVLAAVALAVVAGIGVALLMGGDDHAPPDPGGASEPAPVSAAPQAPSASTPESAAPAPEPSPREFVVDTEPIGASVTRGSRHLGETPLSVHLRPEELPTTLTIAKEGFLPMSVELRADASDIVFERLQRAPKPSPAQPPEPPESKPSPPRSKPSKPRERSPKPTRPAPTREERLSDQKVEKVLDEFLVE